MEALTLLFWLLVGHAMADFPLQSSKMAEGKNRNREIQPDTCENWTGIHRRPSPSRSLQGHLGLVVGGMRGSSRMSQDQAIAIQSYILD